MIPTNFKTAFESDHKYFAVMVVCFIYAGVSLVLFISAVYMDSIIVQLKSEQGERLDDNLIKDDINFLDYNKMANTPREKNDILFGLMKQIRAPLALTQLIGGIIALLAGLSLWNLLRKKERKKIIASVSDSLLLPDEQEIFKLLRLEKSGLTQSKLVIESGLSKVKVHRIIKKFESKGLIEKHKYGATNKLFLKE